jgi:S-adenosylmethionine decarboxylase
MVMEMKSVGRHLVVELWQCQGLDDPQMCEETLKEAVKRAGATLIALKVHRFNPHGLTGIAIIAESHISIHTWPELKYAALDIFTCGEKVDPLRAVEPFVEWLKPKHTQMMEIRRGVISNGR